MAETEAMSIKPPDLEWLEGGVPRAQDFDDTYFSKAGGRAETRHVFLGGNRLPGRVAGRDSFTVAEFGFGTGLNFLTTLEALKDLVPAPRLTFVSFELHPMTQEQLKRALAAFPELDSLAEALLKVWAPQAGWNRYELAGAQLLVGVGDARDLIGDLVMDAARPSPEKIVISPVDAWYLDGFSPARNPELWEAGLLRSAADLTAPEGTLATYTAAGWVRRNLQAAGFAVEKTRGFAGKREMVVGRKA